MGIEYIFTGATNSRSDRKYSSVSITFPENEYHGAREKYGDWISGLFIVREPEVRELRLYSPNDKYLSLFNVMIAVNQGFKVTIDALVQKQAILIDEMNIFPVAGFDLRMRSTAN